MAKEIISEQFKLNATDFLKGSLTAALVAVAATSGQLIEAWITSPEFAIDKVSMVLTAKAALAGFVGYMLKQFLQPTQKTIIGK